MKAFVTSIGLRDLFIVKATILLRVDEEEWSPSLWLAPVVSASLSKNHSHDRIFVFLTSCSML